MARTQREREESNKCVKLLGYNGKRRSVNRPARQPGGSSCRTLIFALLLALFANAPANYADCSTVERRRQKRFSCVHRVVNEAHKHRFEGFETKIVARASYMLNIKQPRCKNGTGPHASIVRSFLIPVCWLEDNELTFSR